MEDPTNRRKDEVIDLILSDGASDRNRSHFDAVRLRHRALPQLDLQKVDPSVTFMGRRLSFPLLISSMTGGDAARLAAINRNLALAAQATGVAMGVGSQRVMFTHPASRESFALRRYAPDALLMANLGAVQLNRGFGPDQCRAAVEAVGADALILHLNPLQEAVQPEGDTDFSNLAAAIGAVAERLPVPTVIKEVGAGLSPEDVDLLVRRGLRYMDVAGAGGTSWSRIENHRRADGGADGLGLVFQDWGIPTPQALRMLRPWRDRVTLIASGGIRTGVDMAKAMVLGASLCGIARPLLAPAMESAERVIEAIGRIRRELVTAMFLLGIGTADRLVGNEALLMEEPVK